MRIESGRHGIHIVDTGFHRPRFDACYLMVENGRAAFVDCGTNHSQPHLLAALASVGLGVDAVDFLVLTHVHLDHAGGAGALMAQLPNARLVVHPRGAPHMIDPSRLIAGASAVYGADEVARAYGQLIPVEPDRVIEAGDQFSFELAGRPLVCFDAPGHARHHLVLWDARSPGFFTGDCFGLAYPELDTARGPFILPTTTPVQFEPQALKATIGRMMAQAPEIMYLTHFGPIEAAPELARALTVQIDSMVELAIAATRYPESSSRLRNDLGTLYLDRAVAHGCSLTPERIAGLVEMDIELNAQGLEIWRDRAAKRA